MSDRPIAIIGNDLAFTHTSYATIYAQEMLIGDFLKQPSIFVNMSRLSELGQALTHLERPS